MRLRGTRGWSRAFAGPLCGALLVTVGCSRPSLFGPTPARPLPQSYGVVTQTWSPAHAAWTAQLGVGWVRLDFNWFEIELQFSHYQWATIDARVADAAAYGLRIYATLVSTPAWAGPSERCTVDNTGDRPQSF